MIHNLVRNTAVVLQQIVVLRTRSECYLLRNGQNVSQRIVRQLMQLGCMVLWDDQAVAGRTRANVLNQISHTYQGKQMTCPSRQIS